MILLPWSLVLIQNGCVNLLLIYKDELNSKYPCLLNIRDREFETFSESSFFIEDEEELFILDNINPGISKTYTLIYEIPEDANELMLEVTSLEFAGNREYIDLGL